jgi:hypothetical protein
MYRDKAIGMIELSLKFMKSYRENPDSMNFIGFCRNQAQASALLDLIETVEKIDVESHVNLEARFKVIKEKFNV